MDGGGTSAVATADQAVRIATVHACWKVLAESIAALPCHVYRRDGDRRVEASDHPLNEFLSWGPGQRQTRFDLWENAVTSMCATGKSAYQIVRNGLGEVVDLVGLDVTRLKPIDEQATRFIYDEGLGKPPREFPREQLWICNYFMGLSPLALAARQLEQAGALDAFAHSYFANQATPGGALEYPGQLTEEARVRLRKEWEATHGGPQRAWRVALLQGGVKYTPFTISNSDAQFLESRRFSKEEIAAIYRVPAHMVNDLTRATFSNIEHMSISFVKYSLLPWLVRLEQSIYRDLLSPEDQKAHYYVAFTVDGLLRGDYATRMTGYATAINSGIMTPNEVRALEDLPPVDGGDELLLPLNMRPSAPPPGAAAPAAEEPEDDEEPDEDDAEEDDDADAQ